MQLLTINAGSSSLRLGVFGLEDGKPRSILSRHYQERPESPEIVLGEVLSSLDVPQLTAVSHRVVHGGKKLRATRIVDNEVEEEIERLSELAPLHNPEALRWIRASKKVLTGRIPHCAVFDTAFFANLPEVARSYALPKEICARHAIQRYGFHGLAHRAMWNRWSQLERRSAAGSGKIITLQLGAGCSITAVANGRAMDTSMGFSPLEGLVMATRSGDVDPGLLIYLQEKEKFTDKDLGHLLNDASGLLGVSGVSADMREVLRSQESAAKLAVELYCYRARKYIGAYLSVLEGADAVVFGGGVGENAPEIRERILAPLSWSGLLLDSELNNKVVGTEACVSHQESSIQAWVLPVDEQEVLAAEAIAFLSGSDYENPISNDKDTR